MKKDEPVPNVAEVLAEVLQRVPPAQQPLLIAIAERLAAERYRGWAKQIHDPEREAELLACAQREEGIAECVEALHANAAAIQRKILADHPDLPDLNRTLFAGRPLEQQFAMQAEGERMGALTWRALAEKTGDDEARATLQRCAELEERSAVVLERMIAEGVATA